MRQRFKAVTVVLAVIFLLGVFFWILPPKTSSALATWEDWVDFSQNHPSGTETGKVFPGL